MTGYWKGALCAAALMCASEAQAANFLVVDIAAVGSGFTDKNVGNQVQTSVFTTLYASLSYNLEGNFSPVASADSLALVGSLYLPDVYGIFTSTGFGFRARYSQFKVSYDIAGKACYQNGVPTTVTIGSPSLGASCDPFSISYGNGFAMESLNFTGMLSGINFRVVDANELPAITFAIPEASTWALMLAGFGMVGYAIRRRRPSVVFG